MESSLPVLIGIGLLAGFTGALLGLGGGIFVVPLLALVLGLPMPVAIGISLVGVAATSITGSITYLRERLTNVRLAMVMEAVATVGAVAGAWLVVFFSQSLLAGLFGCLLVYAAYSMIKGYPVGWYAESCDEGGDKLGAVFFDRGERRTVSYGVRRLSPGMLASGFAGLVSGLLGVGGGIIKVPAMVLIMGVPVRAAVATSNLMVGITAAASALVYFCRGDVPSGMAAPVVLGVCLGAWLGARVACRAGGRLLQLAFAAVTGVAAVMMFLKALGVGFA